MQLWSNYNLLKDNLNSLVIKQLKWKHSNGLEYSKLQKCCWIRSYKFQSKFHLCMCILYTVLEKLILKYIGDFRVPVMANNLMRKRAIITGPDQQALYYYKVVFTDSLVFKQGLMHRTTKQKREPRNRMKPTQSQQMTEVTMHISGEKMNILK